MKTQGSSRVLPKTAAGQEKFSGFPLEGLRFLKDLKKNNDRDWFRERKEIYERTVHEPMALLVTDVAETCRKRGLLVATKEKQPVMRVYRDVRFSPDKRPYKTHVGAGLKPLRATLGEVYIHISPEESFAAAGFWMPERAFLQAWRTSLVSDEGKNFLGVVRSLGKAGLEFSKESQLKKLPRGYERHADSHIADALRLTSYVTVRDLQPREYRSAALVKTICDFALATKPLLEYGWSLGFSPKRDLLEERP
ncbi:MAG TPA: TIGR02453 family protein [Bryobacteraceae bacterium]|jgi:uncharacterized protein (TIGR02453 family)|nr:TIGR02453 family protein [Bryobacteraceae bacterium]